MSYLPSPRVAVPRSNSARLRIVHGVFSSRIAGSERYCIDLANQQAALGHEVHVVGAAGSPIAHELDCSIRFHGMSRLLRGWRLRRLMRRLEPDVCHGHLSAACKAFGRLPSRHLRVATLHVGYKPHQHGRLDGVICVNRAQARRLEGYPGAVRTIPNWLPAIRVPEASFSLRRELGVDENTLVVSCVGRLHESKGVDLLISAFRAAAPSQARLVILGEGPQRAELERLCAGDNRIRFLGYRPQVHDCLRESDLFVSPSREESFGLAIIEAMNLGLPVIATMTEGPLDYLQDQPVTLVPLHDSQALAEAIAESAARFAAGVLPHQAYDLGTFDPSARVGDIVAFYRQLLRVRVPAPAVWESSPAAAS